MGRKVVIRCDRPPQETSFGILPTNPHRSSSLRKPSRQRVCNSFESPPPSIDCDLYHRIPPIWPLVQSWPSRYCLSHSVSSSRSRRLLACSYRAFRRPRHTPADPSSRRPECRSVSSRRAACVRKPKRAGLQSAAACQGVQPELRLFDTNEWRWVGRTESPAGKEIAACRSERRLAGITKSPSVRKTFTRAAFDPNVKVVKSFVEIPKVGDDGVFHLRHLPAGASSTGRRFEKFSSRISLGRSAACGARKIDERPNDHSRYSRNPSS